MAGVAALWPRFVAWPLAVLGAWLGIAWLLRAAELKREAFRRRATAALREADPPPGGGEGD